MRVTAASRPPIPPRCGMFAQDYETGSGHRGEKSRLGALHRASVGFGFVIRLSLEAGWVRGNALAIENAPEWLVCVWICHSLVLAYRLRVEHESGCGCTNPETLPAFDPNQLRSRAASGQ